MDFKKYFDTNKLLLNCIHMYISKILGILFQLLSNREDQNPNKKVVLLYPSFELTFNRPTISYIVIRLRVCFIPRKAHAVSRSRRSVTL